MNSWTSFSRVPSQTIWNKAVMERPKKILMVEPKGFQIQYAINPFMDTNNKADENLAFEQWKAIKEKYSELGLEVLVMDGDPDFPDMVFSANPIFSHPGGVLLGHMKYGQRQGEVEHYQKFLSHLELDKIETPFEGMGDLLWDYDRGELFGGYGYRTELESLELVAKKLGRPIHLLPLQSEKFYHLDTCLSIINKSTALYVKEAFTATSLELLNEKFDHLIEVSPKEATDFLACNAHSPDGENVLIEQGATELASRLIQMDLKVHPLDTSEFLKSGGSIFCMKHQGWF